MSDNHNFIANSVISSNCAETPESNKIGLVKSLAMTATITIQNSTQYMIIKLLLDKNTHTKHPFDVDPLIYNQYVKIFINGNLTKICKIKYSYELYLQLKKARFDNIIDKYTTILFDFDFKEIKIYSDGGRLIRPLLVVND
jgi:DNA-directed RNA polymerase II subunit RPB2